MTGIQQNLFTGRLENYAVSFVRLRLLRESTNHYNSPITRKEDIIQVLRPIYKEEHREVLTTIGLNSQNAVQIIHTTAVGGVNYCHISPAECLRPVLLSNCTAMIIVHSHPGGGREPSSADVQLTKKLKDACKIMDIDLLDHLIVTNSECTEYVSMREKSCCF
jgi:DNA repair protein RadC